MRRRLPRRHGARPGDREALPTQGHAHRGRPPAGQRGTRRNRAGTWSAEVAPGDGGAHTTHLTITDGMGNVVASTQTINSLFGARYIVPGTGMIPNNYMFVFDPHPGRASSIAAGKRITSSMS